MERINFGSAQLFYLAMLHYNPSRLSRELAGVDDKNLFYLSHGQFSHCSPKPKLKLRPRKKCLEHGSWCWQRLRPTRVKSATSGDRILSAFTYTTAGRMSALLTFSSRRPLSVSAFRGIGSRESGDVRNLHLVCGHFHRP